MTEVPPTAVLAAFGTTGAPLPLEGGQGDAFRAGDLVLKPAEDGESAWVAELLDDLVVPGVRVAEPVRATDGSWVVDGWAATRWVPGTTGPEGRWGEVLDVCDRVQAALAGAARPGFIAERSHRWARSDRMAWEEADLGPHAEDELVGRLVACRRPWDAPAQLVHGDLAGNVLFAEGLPPAVIDWSLYWRPAAYARAVVVVDGLLWYGADDALAVAEAGREGGSQALVRALTFRLVVDLLARAELRDREAFPARYAEVVDLAAGLAGG